MKPFRHMALVDSRLDFNSKKFHEQQMSYCGCYLFPYVFIYLNSITLLLMLRFWFYLHLTKSESHSVMFHHCTTISDTENQF